MLILISHNAFADVPLLVENLVTPKGTKAIELGIIYGNNKIKSSSTVGYVPIKIDSSSYINLPTYSINEETQNEFILSALNVKYGLAKNLDINLRTNYLYTSTRYLNIDNQRPSLSEKNISDISLGFNYQFLEDETNPALIGFLETTLYENNNSKNPYFQSYTFGITTYRMFDPIVLSLSSGYKYNRNRKLKNSIDYKPSDFFFINPQLAFAANDKISLIGGLNFISIQNEAANNKTILVKRNNLDYTFGLGFGVSDSSSLRLLSTTHHNFDNSSEILLSFSKNF